MLQKIYAREHNPGDNNRDCTLRRCSIHNLVLCRMPFFTQKSSVLCQDSVSVPSQLPASFLSATPFFGRIKIPLDIHLYSHTHNFLLYSRLTSHFVLLFLHACVHVLCTNIITQINVLVFYLFIYFSSLNLCTIRNRTYTSHKFQITLVFKFGPHTCILTHISCYCSSDIV